MRLIFWNIAVLGSVGTAAVMPRISPVREVLVTEASGTGNPSGLGNHDAGLPQSGGPEIALPAASVLLGMGILMYALLRRKRA